MKKMNELLQALIADGLELDNFYVVTIHENDIRLQGRYNPVLIKKYSSLGFIAHVETEVNGFVEMNKDKINITFTN